MKIPDLVRRLFGGAAPRPAEKVEAEAEAEAGVEADALPPAEPSGPASGLDTARAVLEAERSFFLNLHASDPIPRVLARFERAFLAAMPGEEEVARSVLEACWEEFLRDDVEELRAATEEDGGGGEWELLIDEDVPGIPADMREAEAEARKSLENALEVVRGLPQGEREEKEARVRLVVGRVLDEIREHRRDWVAARTARMDAGEVRELVLDVRWLPRIAREIEASRLEFSVSGARLLP